MTDPGQRIIRSVTADPAAAAWTLYEAEEERYLTAIAGGANDAEVAAAAAKVAAAAAAVDRAEVGFDISTLSDGTVVNKFYDVPEVLSTLWLDISTAHARRVGRNL